MNRPIIILTALLLAVCFITLGIVVGLGAMSYISGVASETAVAQTTGTASAIVRETTEAQAATATARVAAANTLVAGANATDEANANIVATVQAAAGATASMRNATATVRRATAIAESAQNRLETGAQWTSVLSDTFDRDTGHWSLGIYDQPDRVEKRIISEGKYRWEIAGMDDDLKEIKVPVDPLSDLYVAVDVRQVSGDPNINYGLTFRQDSRGNYYYFAVNNQGEYLLSLYYNRQSVTLIPPTPASTYKPFRTNRLTVLAEGPRLMLFVNDQYMAQVQDTRLTGGLIGLVIGVGKGRLAAFEFDNFDLRTPSSGPVPTSTLQPTQTPGPTPLAQLK